VPLYLHRFLKDHGTGSITNEKLNAFEKSLTAEIRSRVDGFLTEFSSRKGTYSKAGEHMAAEMPIENGDTYFLNQQFMWHDEKELIRCTTPIARTCLIKAVRTTWNFFTLAEQLFSNTSDFTNDTKGVLSRLILPSISPRIIQSLITNWNVLVLILSLCFVFCFDVTNFLLPLLLLHPFLPYSYILFLST
jgi:hypothetical protein